MNRPSAKGKNIKPSERQQPALHEEEDIPSDGRDEEGEKQIESLKPTHRPAPSNPNTRH
jgi:hypothetical protein